jgi:hypothetical protein
MLVEVGSLTLPRHVSLFFVKHVFVLH